MNSKEALERLYDGYQNGMAGRSFYDIIKQDLEVLEILKSILEIKKGSSWEYLDTKHCFFDTQEQIEIIKEWLKREE